MTRLMPTHRLSTLLALCLTCALSAAAPAQTLARPGWAGSGLTAEPWWKHAVIYEVDPAGFNPAGFNKGGASELKGVTERLDYVQSLGVDALLLTPIQTATANVQSVDPSYGTVDDLDELIHQASSHNIRVLLTLSSGVAASDLTAAARLWLNHGVAGFHLAGASGTAADAYLAQIGELHKVTNSYVGQRIVIGDLRQSAAADAQAKVPQAKAPQGRDAQLLLDPRAGTASQLSAAVIRPAIDASEELLQAGVMPVLLSDGPEYARSVSRYGNGKDDVAIAKALATVLLASRAGSLIYYGQELGVATASASDPAAIRWYAPPVVAKGTPATEPSAQPAGPNVALEDADKASLLNWYRQLSVLHHGNRTVSTGATVTINRDDQNVLVWVRKPQVVSKISPPIVVICNLSAQPVHLALKEDIKRLHLRGSFLRTVLRTDTGSGPMHLESMTISPFGVYIGELRF